MLKVIASADLGGLGAKEGRPVTYNWLRGSLLPVALPWLATLLLLVVVKPNRDPRAWWIAAPLVGLSWATSLLPTLWPAVPANVMELFQDLAGVLVFGLGAVWLFSAYFKSQSRFLNVLGVLVVLVSFSSLLFLLTQDWSEGDVEMVQGGIFLGVGALVISAAVVLAGLLCRRRYRPLVLCAWLAALLLGIWFLVMAPFFLATTAGRGVPATELLVPVLAVAGVCFAALLPFLLLSFANAFYRERLIRLLVLAPRPAEAVAAPAPTVMSSVTVERLKAAAAATHDQGPTTPKGHDNRAIQP